MKWKQRVRHIKRKMKDSSATDHIMNAIFFEKDASIATKA